MPDTLPLVIVRTAISLDGATTGFEIDMGVYYYDLARTFIEDVSLTGVDTILQTTADLAETAMPGPIRLVT